MPKYACIELEQFVFVFGFLLSMPKVGGQEQKILILAMLRTPSTKFRNSKCGQGIVFALNFLLLASKIGNQEQKTFVLNHAQISMHKVGGMFFVFSLLLSVPKVGGQEHDVLMFKIW
jgi:hypothetical protein